MTAPKSIFTSAALHYTSTPSLLSCAFCGTSTVVYVAGRHLCFFDTATETREFVPLPEGVFAAKCLAATGPYVALATSGIFPCIYVFKNRALEFVIPKAAELDIPDLQFSACASRLFALGKSSTATKLLIYSTADGSLLPGCENVTALQRYQVDRLFVSPLDKDRVFLCNSARRVCQLVRIARRFKRYIVTICDNSIPELGDSEMLAPLEGYTWTPRGRFLVSTRNAVLLLCKDTGMILYTWRSLSAVEDERLVNGYVTNLMFMSSFLVATHEVALPNGNTKQYFVYWLYDAEEENNLNNLSDLFRMCYISDSAASPELAASGSVTSLQPNPDYSFALVTTASGALFKFSLLTQPELDEVARKLEEDILGEAEELALDWKFLSKCHVNFITASCFLHDADNSFVTADETGLIQSVAQSGAVKTVRLPYGINTIAPLAADGANSSLLVGTESGVIRVLKLLPSGNCETLDTVRLASFGFSAQLAWNSTGNLLLASAFDSVKGCSLFAIAVEDKKALKCYGKIPLGTDPDGVELDSCAVEDVASASSDAFSSTCAAVGTATYASSLSASNRLWTWKTTQEATSSCNVETGFLEKVVVTPVQLGAEPCSVAMSNADPDTIYVGYCNGVVSSLSFSEILSAQEKVKALLLQREQELAASAAAEPTGEPPAAEAGEESAAPGGTDDENAKPEEEPELPKILVTTSLFPGPASGAYATPATSSTSVLTKETVVAEAVLVEHEQPISSLRCITSSLLAAATMDGVVILVQKSMPIRKYQLADPFGGGIWSFAAQMSSSSSSFYGLMTSSSEVCTFSVDNVVTEGSYVVQDWKDMKLGRNVAVEAKGESETEMAVWTAAAASAAEAVGEEDPAVVAANEQARQQLQSGLTDLRKRLSSFLTANGSAPDLEKLDRGEFCIDTEERDFLVEKADKQCEDIRDRVERENLARNLICKRLVQEFWQPMKTPGCTIASLQGPQSVANYPERKLHASESSRTRMIAQLRDVELLEKEEANVDNDWYLDAGKFLPPGMDRAYFINFYGGDENLYSPTTGEGKKLTEAEQKELDDSLAVRNRVYTPFELTTNMRRKTQIVLLQTLSTDLQKAFNRKFGKCQGTKKEVMSHIKEKIDRIRSILKELQIDEVVDEPELLGKEVPESVLKVEEKEVTVAKYISPEEKKKKDEEAKLLAEKSAKKTNDAGQRALQQMMGGRLKTNKDLTPLERVVDREVWMDEVPPEHWTELQQQLYVEYEARCAALATEQENYKQLLNAELTKLRAEVLELKKNFEDKLSLLAADRHQADLHYYWQEIYIIRLFLALLQAVEDQGIKEFILQEIQSAQGKVQEAEEVLEMFAEKVRTHEKIHEEHVKRDKELVSKFREHFPQLEPDQQTFLLKLFKQRPPKPAGAAGDVNVKGPILMPFPVTIEKLNPFKPPVEDAGNTSPSSKKPEPMIEVDYNGENIDTLHVPVLPNLPEETLKFPEDCSMEGIGKQNFDLMLDLKHQKMLMEIEIQKLNGVHVEMVKLMDHYQAEVETNTAVFEKEVDDLRAHQSMIENEEEDYEIMVQLKQGQVEVPPAAVVTDYSDALTFHKEVIEARNRRILELGGEKVGLLEAVREFRKKINMVAYDQNMFALQKTDLQERTKDVQFLRVTKDVQEIMSGGDEKKRQRAIEILEKKLDHVTKGGVTNIANWKMKYTKLSQDTRKLQKKNDGMSNELDSVVKSVNERQKIKNLQQGGTTTPLHMIGKRKKTIGGGGAIAELDYKTPNTRFAEARRRKVMQDRMTNQDEELKTLRTELDRLRQKTFPSFVQVHDESGHRGVAD
ncbi:unnamed protein product [Amoebophrya sp. A120]|nr:unnamed protein product [Amoebophrya sp. A120]|eukprot:GSA120T00010239001.1